MANQFLKECARKYVDELKILRYYKPGENSIISKLCHYILDLTDPHPECDFDKYGATVTNCDPWEPPSDCNVCPPTPTKFIVIATSKLVTMHKSSRDYCSDTEKLMTCWEIIGYSYHFEKAENIAKEYIGRKLGLQCIIQEHVVYG